MKAGLPVLGVLALSTAAATAQPEGFGARMDATLAPAGDVAPFLRCAGLFRAFRLLAGEDTETGADALDREVDLAVLASLLREAETGAGRDAVMAEIVPLIAGAAELYLDRMVANDAATGRVLDDGLAGSLAVCAELQRQGPGAGGARRE